MKYQAMCALPGQIHKKRKMKQPSRGRKTLHKLKLERRVHHVCVYVTERTILDTMTNLSKGLRSDLERERFVVSLSVGQSTSVELHQRSTMQKFML